MYPHDLLFGIDLYEIFIVLGLVSVFLVYKFYLTRNVISVNAFNFYLIVAIGSIVLGFIIASLMQSLFTLIKTGKFSLFNDGITFYGGLFGGILCFIGLTFGLGAIIFKKNREHIVAFKQIFYVAPCCITIAHALGRLGCLFAGCCHGKVTDGFGIVMYVSELNGFYKCVPIQLYESLFLFALFFVVTYMYFKKYHYEMETYAIGYGVWRFIIEYFRSDDRGALILGVVTPSQGFAILFILFGISIIIYKILKNKNNNKINNNKISV